MRGRRGARDAVRRLLPALIPVPSSDPSYMQMYMRLRRGHERLDPMYRRQLEEEAERLLRELSRHLRVR